MAVIHRKPRAGPKSQQRRGRPRVAAAAPRVRRAPSGVMDALTNGLASPATVAAHHLHRRLRSGVSDGVCPAGTSCGVLGVEGEEEWYSECLDFGTATHEEPCSDFDDCVPRYGCSIGGCLQYCDPAAGGDCPDGRVCADDPPLIVGATNVGYCMDPP